MKAEFVSNFELFYRLRMKPEVMLNVNPNTDTMVATTHSVQKAIDAKVSR